MTDKQSSSMSAGKNSSKEERLSAALRENLKRRKAQSRQRADDGYEQGGQPPADSASNCPEKDKN